MTYLDLFNIVSRPWASVKEIKLVGNCGRDKATQIRDQIKNLIEKSGKRVPDGKIKVVPMPKVVEYFNLDVRYIGDMARQEKDITFYTFAN